MRGYLVKQGDRVQLCSALAESYPPQCAAPALRVRGDLDLARLGPLRTEGATTWSEQPVLLLGEVRNGEIMLSARTRG